MRIQIARFLIAIALLSLRSHLLAGNTPLLCEWQGDGAVVNDPCPEFYWQTEGQAAYRIIVSASRESADRALGDMWDTAKVQTPLSIAEYDGKPLQDGHSYWWRLKTWDSSGKEGDFRPPSTFTFHATPLPQRFPHIRTFVNFGSNPELIAKRYDLTFRSEAKRFNPRIIALRYALLATLVVPSEKAAMLERFCVEHKLATAGIDETMFLHFREDRDVTLHVGAERASNPVVKRRVPGWDPANDRNNDGAVGNEEFARLANPNAHARKMAEARVPIYYWGPPADDFVMNVGNRMYQRFLAEVYAPSQLGEDFDGLWIDTAIATPPGAANAAELLEYPRTTPVESGAWLRDMQTMLAKVKIALRGRPLFANCWNAKPFVLDGTEWENWLNIGSSSSAVLAQLSAVADLERRGKIQEIQYNPIYDPKETEFGARVPVTKERDRIYGLALYYLIAGQRTYFGFGQHPYVKSEDKFFPAIECDIGGPKRDYFVFKQEDAKPVGPNVLRNGGFEEGPDSSGRPSEWITQRPIELDAQSPKIGKYCVRVATDSEKSNNINKQLVQLDPDTYYTLSAWVKTENVSGPTAAQVYPYEFDDADYGKAAILITTGGTHDWQFHSYVFKTGKDTKGRINFRIYGGAGAAWFDEISLVKGAFFELKVLGREFDKALVLVRPPVGPYGDITGQSLKLPATMRHLRMDGTLGDPSDAVALRGGEAAILIR